MVQMFRQDQPGFKFTDVMPNDRFDLISFAADKIHQLHQRNISKTEELED